MLVGWLLAALASVGFACLDGVRKRIVRTVDPVAALVFLRSIETALLLLGSFLFETKGVPAADSEFWSVFPWAILTNVAGNLLYMRALSVSPLSLTIPYLAFTPVILLFTGWLALGERPTVYAVAGVVLIAAGAFQLNRRGQAGLGGPLLVLLRERGSVLMLVVSVLWAVGSTLDKIAVRHAPPALYAGLVEGAAAIVAASYLGIKRREALRPRRGMGLWFVAGGVLGAVSIVGQLASLQWLFVSYTIALKRAGMVLSVLIGHVFFGEVGLRERLSGAAIMVAGVLLIVLG